MSEKDTKMLPISDGNMGEKILSILDRVVTYPKDKEDCKSLEKSASSPDSAIDLTEDSKHLCESSQDFPFDIQSCVTEILSALIDDVYVVSRRRERKKKREKFSDTEKWNLIKQETTIGWKRILSRNSDDLKTVISHLAQRLFDPVPAVRLQVSLVAADLLLNWPTAYSNCAYLLPLLLTG